MLALLGCVTETVETETVESAVRRDSGGRARIASSGFSSCAILGAGRIKCFGDNTSGQIGDGTRVDRMSPVYVGNLIDAIDIAVTPSRAIALTSTGAVWQWGMLESGISTVPQPVALTDAIELMGGGGSPCALRDNGTVACWGTLAGTNTTTAIPTSVSGLVAVASLAKGSAHCVVTTSGSVKCWGSNSYGQLGDGTQTPSSSPVTVSGIANARVVAGSTHHACALLANGGVKCWGRNNHGQLGNGTETSFSATPVSVSGISTAKALAVGAMHSCAILANGTARCWGMGANGQLGNGNDAAYSTPQVVSQLTNAVELASDGDTTTALLASGGLRAWGRGTHGALGSGGTLESLSPVMVAGLFDQYNSLHLQTAGLRACALLPSGRVKCWGNNHVGQFGNGTTTNSATPVQFGSATNYIDVSGDGFATCAVRSDGTVWCAGDTAYVSSTTPVQLAGITNAVAIELNGTGCVLLASGGVKCFGYGNGGDSSEVIAVPGITDAVAIAVGPNSRCALRAGGTAQCWGNNGSGELGNGTTTPSETPVTVRVNSLFALTNIVALSVGVSRACAVLGDGTVRCWGAGNNGFGTGTPLPHVNPYPVTVVGLADAVDVSVGYLHMCGLRSGGGVRCWGDGQSLGAGELDGDQLAPLDVGGATPLTRVTQVDASSDLTCAALANGTAKCWGGNGHGQLGTGVTGGHAYLPVNVVGL